MSRDELKKLVDEGHEIEFDYNGKKYSITYGELNGKEVISFCEFYKETTEVDTFEKLCEVKRDGKTVIEMMNSITEKDMWIY